MEPVIVKANIDKTLDIHERRALNYRIMKQQLAKIQEKLPKTKKVVNKNNHSCDLFVGYWLLDSCEDWDHFTLFQIYKDLEGNPRCKFYDGTQPHLREVNASDLFTAQNPTAYFDFFSTTLIDIEIEILSATSFRFVNTLPHLTTDDLTSTFRIQEDDNFPNVAICQLFTDFDGSADDAHYGSVENISLFKRLPARPDIQMNYLPSFIDWTNPVNMFNYVNEFYFYLGMPQKAVALHQNNYIGWQQAEALRNVFLTTGVERVSQVSKKKRGGKFLGVWKTQFPEIYPVTTITTKKIHRFNPGSTVHIKGFRGVYKILNGTHKIISLPPPTFSTTTPYPWQFEDSREYNFHIPIDTSAIEEEYDPCLHAKSCGVTITAHHGPVTATTEYRDFFAALYDYNSAVWGPGTHSRIRSWINPENNQIPETFTELQEGIANDTLILLTNNFRTYTAGPRHIVYHNPVVQGGNPRFPAVNINDPYHLGDMEFNEYYDYDIDLNNYLDHDKTFSLFWTVTGPILPDEPLTGLLLDLGLGYPSNGSQVVWKVNPWGVFPADLEDEFGVHPWRLYGAVDNTEESIRFQLHYNFVFGLINEKYTKGKKIGYIRVGDETSFDNPFVIMTTRSLAFGRNDMPFNKIKSNCIFGMANCVAKLNEFGVEKIIMDMRDNGGGFAHLPSAFAVPFGGNRVGFRNQMGFPGNGNRDPVEISESGFKTAFDSLQINNETDELINTDELYNLFPEGVFRGTETCRKELIILTNSSSASAGDMLPSAFLGPDPFATAKDIGHFVTARIIGDIDGRLWSGIKAFDSIAVNTDMDHNLYQNGEPRSAIFLATEGGLMNQSRHFSLVNESPATVPDVLIHAFYNDTVWQDLGLISPEQKYPLCKHKKGLPDYNVRETWRDVFLEYAIAK
jgi:hypothetical protein